MILVIQQNVLPNINHYIICQHKLLHRILTAVCLSCFFSYVKKFRKSFTTEAWTLTFIFMAKIPNKRPVSLNNERSSILFFPMALVILLSTTLLLGNTRTRSTAFGKNLNLFAEIPSNNWHLSHLTWLHLRPLVLAMLLH